MAKKKSGGGGGANWMDTYGDMVTLLLCFFVLLYSMSTISEDKWKAIVQSFNPSGVIAQLEEIQGGSGPSSDANQGGGVFVNPDVQEAAQEEINQMIEELYEAMKNMVAEEGLASTIQVELTGGVVYIRFSDTVMFRGDSYAIEPAGRDILSKLCALLDTAKPAIDEIKVVGHTAQAQANVRNPVEGDRRLAANRAASVVIFLQENSTIHPARIYDVGRGQWWPVSSNATGESRAFNRRVEMEITGIDLSETELNEALSAFITRDDEDGGLHSTNGAD